MPLIKDVLKEIEHKKKFQKKSYRPWDDEISVPPSEEKRQESNGNTDGFSKSIETFASEKSATDSLTSLLPDMQKQEETIKLDMEKCLRELYGAQRIVFKFLVNLQVEEIGGIFITQPVATNEIALATKLPANTIKTVIGRLKNKSLIKTSEWKPGRGGYGRYGFDIDVYNFFLKRFAET